MAKPLVALADRYDPSTLARFFLAPTPPMPRFELDGDERAALAAFLLASESGSERRTDEGPAR